MIAALIDESQLADFAIAAGVIAAVGYVGHQFRRATRGLAADLFAAEWHRNDHADYLDAFDAWLDDARTESQP